MKNVYTCTWWPVRLQEKHSLQLFTWSPVVKWCKGVTGGWMMNYKYEITKLFKLQFKMSIFSQKSWFSGGSLNVYVEHYHTYNKLLLLLRLVNLVCFDRNQSCIPEKYVNTSGKEQVALMLSWAWITGVFATM